MDPQDFHESASMAMWGVRRQGVSLPHNACAVQNVPDIEQVERRREHSEPIALERST